MRPSLLTATLGALLILLAGSAAFAQTPTGSDPSSQTVLQFKLGFKSLADQMPDLVGQPVEAEHHGANGDSLQQTTKGLMVWRKADNWTAFTNGAFTWVNGPYGVQSRENGARFPWEAQVAPSPAGFPEIPIWDRRSVATAYIVPGDGDTIYLWTGQPVAYLLGEDVYGFNGNHLGWFIDGIVWDWEGVAVGFTRQAPYVAQTAEPPKAPRQTKPASLPREAVPAKPPFTLGVYTELLVTMLQMGVTR